MKNTSLIILALFSVFFQPSPSHAEEKSLHVLITPLQMQRPEGATYSSLICLGAGWNQADSLVASQIVLLKQASPHAFEIENQPGNPNECLDPDRLDEESTAKLDAIIARIGVLTKNEIALAIPPSSNQAEQPSDDEDFKLRNEEAAFGKKLLRAELFIQGTQVAGMGVLLLLPPDVTRWSDQPLADASKNLKRAWTTAPVWDHDDWAINYVGHPYSGALYYNMLRSQGVNEFGSFLFSTAQSLFWEYGFEAVAEQPSIQDLLFTSTIGSIYGEVGHRLTLKMRRSGFNFGEKVAVLLLNPMYVVNNGFKH